MALFELQVATSMSREVIEGVPSTWRQDSFACLTLDAEGTAALDAHLAPLRSDAERFFFLDSLTRTRGGLPDSAAIVIYPRDYWLTGHFLQLRGERTDVKCTYASYKPADPPAQYPPLSIIYLPEWDILEDLASQSPLLADAWRELATVNHGLRWLCLADPLPSDWVVIAESQDRDVFRRVVGR